MCVCFYLVSISVPFFCIVACVTSAGNESHPPIADEDKGTDRLYRLVEAQILENIQTLLKLCGLFPKWVTMIDRSEPTQCRVSTLELRGKKEKGKSQASKTNS